MPMDLDGCAIETLQFCPNRTADGYMCAGYEVGDTGECAECIEVRFYCHFDSLNILVRSVRVSLQQSSYKRNRRARLFKKHDCK